MAVDSEAARRVGATLCNKWRLDRLIGVGGMAAVYEATHKIGRKEAIKVLHPEIARDRELCARFEQEAHAVNRFKHPGAVEIRDIDVAADGAPFLVMELLDGQPLATIAKRDPGVAVADLLRYTDEVLDVLAAAHAQGIIHRDVKPDNVFILGDGRVKVLDFGIARVRAGAASRLQTRAGATLGTVPYMPPEQIQGEEIDPRADLFAVGATMFRVIARRRIHEAATESALLVKMATEPAPPLASVVTSVSPHIAAVIDRALRFARDDRYPDARIMQGDVRAVREGRAPPFASPPVTVVAVPVAVTPVAGQVAAPPSTVAMPTLKALAAVPPRTVPLTAIPGGIGGAAAVSPTWAPPAAGAPRSLPQPPLHESPMAAATRLLHALAERRVAIGSSQVSWIAIAAAAAGVLALGAAMASWVVLHTPTPEPPSSSVATAAAPSATPTETAAPDDSDTADLGGSHPPRNVGTGAPRGPTFPGGLPSKGGPGLQPSPGRGHIKR